MSPDDALNCLLVQPKFSANNFWNYVDVAKAIGAKTIAPPLGLLTLAAMLPEQWSLTLVDLNVSDIDQDVWDAADVICVGGMLPQQPGILEIIARANESGKYVAVGGPDPTSQPEIYANADALVVGEGEATVPVWLDSWRAGKPNGTFQAADRPEITTSPIPRFELVNFDDYINAGVQFSRGCPFNCEFCDIIELYGRVPRSKTTEQILAELDRLYELGYRGMVDMVDDNFIGNKRQVKPMLTALAKWCQERNYPFYFSIEATMNLADDEELLDLMRQADFRFVFMGIETPDPDLLALTQKRVNSMKPIVERVDKIYEYGLVISAGFILGFDNENDRIGQAMTACIEDTSIVIAMVGLLVALPNTQLARRLQRERRLISTDLEVYTDTERPYRLVTAGSYGELKDNQAAGLNFVTTRDRVEIYRDYKQVIESIFSPKAYMERVMATTRKLKLRGGHKASGWWQVKRELRGFMRTAIWMTCNSKVRWYYWRNTFRTLFMGSKKFDVAQTLMAMYMHFEKQSRCVTRELDENIEFSRHHAAFPRMVDPSPKTDGTSESLSVPLSTPAK